MDSLLLDQLQPSTVPSGATAGQFLSQYAQAQLAVCSGDELHLYSSSEDELQLLAIIPLFELFDALHCLPAPNEDEPDQLLLISAEACVLVVCKLVQSSTGVIRIQEIASTRLHPAQNSTTARRLEGTCCSRLYTPEGSNISCLAVALFTDQIHVVRVQQTTEGAGLVNINIDVTAANLQDLARHADEGRRPSRLLQVQALELVPSMDPVGVSNGNLLLAALQQESGNSFTSRSLDVFEVEAVMPRIQQPSSRAAAVKRPMRILSGLATFRALHPTTSLLCSSPAHGSQPACLLYISSHAAYVIGWDQSPRQTGTATVPTANTSDSKKSNLDSRIVGNLVCTQILQHRMPGLPTCWWPLHYRLGRSVVLVGDSMAGLHMFHRDNNGRWQGCQLHVQGSMSPAAILCGIQPRVSMDSNAATDPQAPSSQHMDTLQVFLGSKQHNSQLLQFAINTQALSTASSTQALASTQELTNVKVIDPMVIKSLAPVQDCLLIPDFQDAGDQTLLLGCGSAPWGRLARAKLGVAFTPYFPHTLTLPENVQLFPLLSASQQNTTSQTTHLAFSFQASGYTEVLSLTGDTFRPATLPGLTHDAATLLLSTLNSGLVVQVTSKELRVLSMSPEAGLLSTWQPPPPPIQSGTAVTVTNPVISLAAIHGNIVVVSTTSYIHVVSIPTSQPYTPTVISSLQLTEPLSSLSVCQNPGANGQSRDDALMVVWGEWVKNRVNVAPTHDLQNPVLVVDVGHLTVRSTQLMPLPNNRCALAVGTNTGSIMLWEVVRHDDMAGKQQWQVQEPLTVQISNVDVQLSLVKQAHNQPTDVGDKRSSNNQGSEWPYLYAHSGQGAIIRVAPAVDTLLRMNSKLDAVRTMPLHHLLQVCRIHGSNWLRAACPINTEAMPCSWAWVTAANNLMFGRLDMTHKLRWTTALTGDSPQHIAYHPSSGCFVMLMEDSMQGQSLRLVHGDTLQPLLTMRLSPSHQYTSLAVGPLPCSSAGNSSITGPSSRQPSMMLASMDPLLTTLGAASMSQAALKHFIILGSYAVTDADGNLVSSTSQQQQPAAAQPAPATKSQGIISVFEIAVKRPSDTPMTATTAAAPSSQVDYELLLHGACPIATTPLCLAICTPKQREGDTVTRVVQQPTAEDDDSVMQSIWDSCQSSRFPLGKETNLTRNELEAGKSAAGLADPVEPCLLVGGHNGVRVYKAHVDDLPCVTAGNAARQAFTAASYVPELAAWEPPPAGLLDKQLQGSGEGDGSGSDSELAEDLYEQYKRRGIGGYDDDEGDPRAQAANALRSALRRDWGEHVIFTEAVIAKTSAQSAVTSLSTKGSVVIATDFLASATVFELTQRAVTSKNKDNWQAYIGNSVISLETIAADHNPIYAQAATLLNERQILLSAHPHGLIAFNMQQSQATGLTGGQQQGEATQSHKQVGNAPALDVAAACCLRHMATHLLPGKLGLHWTPVVVNSPGAASSTSVVAVACDGAVLSVQGMFSQLGQYKDRSGQPKDITALLHECQEHIQDQQDQLGYGLPTTAVHKSGWPLYVRKPFGLSDIQPQANASDEQSHGQGEDDVQLPCHCIDGSLLSHVAMNLRGGQLGNTGTSEITGPDIQSCMLALHAATVT